ncbi:MAG: sigma-54-dependent Fis family transcriptional regulator [Bacteroidaceae bacterium]|nr:sigma-54-dependent Fis family transcriptional regulator [Bacteroidaceae bacterium]
MNRQGTLIVVDDNKNILTSLHYLLNSYFDQIVTLSSPVALPTTIQQKRPDVILLDMNFSAGLNTGNEGLYWLREIKRIRPQTQVVLFTAYADINLAVTGLKEGATDFVVKPWDNNQLVQTLLDALEKARQEKPRQKKVTPANNEGTEMYWGSSEAISQLKLMVERISATDASILITGENGTGKDMLAHEIHRLSNRHEGPFVSVDMGAITETLFESELFGHVKGSFTDAHADRIGRFEAANGGTLFLDEIANLPLHMQPKLLTAIQKRTFVKVGSNLPQPTDIRLICATNRDLALMVQQGVFREDLLYRINTIHLHLPSLRERKEDIIPLAERFLQQFNTQYGRQLEAISPEAAKKLQSHPWYGNVRELQHAMEKAVIMADGRILKPEHIELNAAITANTSTDGKQGMTTQTLEATECEAIRHAMQEYGGNVSQVANALGITRQTLYSKLKRYGI